MDHLDFAVYRFLSPEGIAKFWAGRRVIDPRITPHEVAGRVGISESAVRSRLARLTRQGFLRDRAVVPNPALFGKRVFVADLRIKQPGEVDRILHDLTLVDGVVFTRDVMHEEERKIEVYFVSESDGAASRLAALLGRLTAGTVPVEPHPYYTPPCDRDLTTLDWRVLESVHRLPDATFAGISGSVGISQKTAARIYHQLIDSRACWWTHGADSEEFPMALVLIDVRRADDLDLVAGWIRKEGHLWMPVARDGFGLAPERATTVLAGLAPADRPTVLERFLRNLAAVEGVARIRRTYSLGSALYSGWFLDRVTQRVHSGT